ncbi:hypothetical protein [Rivularia sp. UHCC 0363]|uniref:hypothetical protein n=1 Tax=Rivularia sp. UHCC 0363 TaxID=3110244 RepID=UPI002B20E017|nr:hypothetical protein [Rivularia sp. UHCC 0363]MEA5598354.1 hypothetical protein [Rivularia sp. UHCC 0363]
MNKQALLLKKDKSYIQSSTLLLLGFASVFFPRLLDSVGVPSIINFIHFAIVPIVSLVALFKTQTKNRNQISLTKELLCGILILLGVFFASALLNKAGFINVIIGYLLLAEPFIFLVAVICIPMTPTSLGRLKGWIIGFSCFHIFLALLQAFLLNIGVLRATTMAIIWDNIQGVFYLSGSGHVVGASVSISFGIYYFISAKNNAFWLRISVFFAAFLQLLLADAKQVLLVCFVSWILLILLKLKDIKIFLQYSIGAIIAIGVFLWCMQNLEIFRAFNTWIRPEIYGPDGEATLLKTSSIRIIISYYKLPLNLLLGLGPGHTVGRLGGWMLPKYWDLFGPLGATIHPVSKQTFDLVWGSLLGRSSSMFSPLFGWAGIWGDIGILGLGTYLYISSIVWRRICLDDFSKFLMLNVFVNGLIFSQMEEPGYMLFVAVLIALQWQDRQINKSLKQRSAYIYAGANPSLEIN